MDFGSVLHKAQKNDNQKKEVRYYSTKFEPPKKEQREKKSLSVNIQKFLARKEAEEKHRVDGDRQRRDQLLELRSKDKKATRRVSVMLKRTKSANQSVLDDAIDVNNTAVTLAGPSQPDEDDYGYVSQSAADYYNKMMDKYSKIPDEPKFKTEKRKVSTNLSNTKDRVKAALEREKEEALLPHKRKRKPKELSDLGEAAEDEEPAEKEVKKEKPKPRPNMPPPMNFSDLLKMAEKKQFEPILIEVKKEDKDERLLTKRQRKDADREREYFQQKEARKANANKPKEAQSETPTIPKTNQNIPKASSPNQPKPSCSNPSNAIKDNRSGYSNKPNIERSKPEMPPPAMKRPDGRPNLATNKSSNDRPPSNQVPNQKKPSENVQNYNQSQRVPQQAPSTKDNPNSQQRPLQQNIMKSRDVVPNRNPSQKQQPQSSRSLQSNSKDGAPSNRDVRAKEFPPRDMKPKQFPPKDVRPRQFPPQEKERFPKKDVKRNIQSSRRIYDDDEEEYDSEMDDFIDDGDDTEDVSRHIQEIFGYDKRKYSRIDDDCDDMVSTFAQQQKEEVFSTKSAIKEDLEDMKLEEEMKKRKAMMKKRR